MNGQIDAVVADNPLAIGYVGHEPDKLKTVGTVFTDENYGIAVCKIRPELLAKINTRPGRRQGRGPDRPTHDQVARQQVSRRTATSRQRGPAGLSQARLETSDAREAQRPVPSTARERADAASQAPNRRARMDCVVVAAGRQSSAW